nr:immunoglobulin heavy chain junction region [Mus musculus]
CASSYGFAYW